MLTDSTRKHIAGPRKRALDAKGRWYSDSQKLEAVKCWLITGNLVQTAAALSIPLVTIKSWRYSQWWDELVQEIKIENNIKLTTRLKDIASKALEVTVDRLENGEWIFDQKTGNMHRKPVSLRDAHRTAVDLMDRADVLEKKPVEVMAQEKTQDLLAKLAAKFEELSRPKVVVTDVILGVENAVHDQREEGLQEGEGVGEEHSPTESQTAS